MFEIFETDEFKIRKIEISDSAAIYKGWAQNLEVARYTTWVTHSSQQETQTYVENCIADWARNSYTWMIVNKADSTVVGSFAARVHQHKIGIGYLLAMNWWGKGVMTSIVSTFINEAFKIKTIERIGAVCDIENPASKRVMEKAGMQYEGILLSWMKHPNMGVNARDCHSLSITAERYNQRLHGALAE